MISTEQEALLFTSDLQAPAGGTGRQWAETEEALALGRVRGLRAWWRRRQVLQDPHWLIDPAASRRPAWWQGWPRPARFAFAITHDVEGQAGVDRCRALAELELRLGFRSAFHFVTDGDYPVSPELRSDLTRRGFEVAALGSRRRLPGDRPGTVSRCLCDWGAVGFRAGVGGAGPNGVGDLGIEYDSSRSDTGRFEAGGARAGSIFPDWVPRAVPGGGFVELPVTLPHDTLVQRIGAAQALAVWQAKTGWIAQQGGLALLNLRADCLDFGRHGGRPDGLPIATYESLLGWVRDHYGERCWHALPREMARRVRQFVPAPPDDIGGPAALNPVRRAVIPAP